MGKRGPRPGFNAKRKVDTTWTPELAYAIGLLATDGCLISKGHLIDLTSKERQQLVNFCRCIGLTLRIGMKTSGKNRGDKKYFRVQFKSVLFYNFLAAVGLTPAKSRTMGGLAIPKKFFWDFLRGSYDGDGSSYAYWDPRWKSSYMFYTIFASASERHVDWLRSEIRSRIAISGHVTRSRGLYQLKYAKMDSLKLLRKMYYSSQVACLARKRLKVKKILRIIGEQL